MIQEARFCKRCETYTRNFQTIDNVYCLTCRKNMANKSHGHLYCSGCGKAVYETYTPQNLCSMCAFAAKVGKANAVKEDKLMADAVKKSVQSQSKSMQKGEIKKLPNVNSPLWTDQWAVQGSGAAPYIVSHKKDGEWQCSCPAWTRNIPREDCKHILKVKLFEKVPTTSTVVLTSTKTAISVESKNGIMALPIKTGRKFR